MTHYNVALLGFGNVGRAVAELLLRKRDELQARYGLTFTLTGVAARRLGWLADPNGLDVAALLAGQTPAAPAWADSDLSAWLQTSRAEVLFENTSLNPETGQPAIDYLKTALNHGAHVITANKGPVVHAYHALQALAAQHGKRFLHEAAVMGGAPIFSLFRGALPATNLLGFRGILNSTTNLILTEMENGLTYEAAVKKAQALGIAETDPSADVDGWDAAVKVSALATVLMDVPVTPHAVAPVGIRGLSAETVRAARAAGRPYKLICQASKNAAGTVSASVRPEQVEPTDPLANVNGASSMITFRTDTLYGLTLSEIDPDALTTAYGPLADFVAIATGR